MEEQLQLLQLMKSPTSHVMYAGSVMDSGSGNHLQLKVLIPRTLH